MKKPIVLKQNQLYYWFNIGGKLMYVLFTYPEKEFSLSELANEAKVSKGNAGPILDKLYAEGMIQIVKLHNIWRIKANQTNWNFIKGKILYNLSVIYQSGIAEFLNELFRNPKAIVLFGSFRKGDDISDSDIDIAIETAEEKEFRSIPLKELGHKKRVDEIEKILARKIQIHLFNRKNVDLNIFNNISNGIVLSGFLEVKP